MVHPARDRLEDRPHRIQHGGVAADDEADAAVPGLVLAAIDRGVEIGVAGLRRRFGQAARHRGVGGGAVDDHRARGGMGEGAVGAEQHAALGVGPGDAEHDPVAAGRRLRHRGGADIGWMGGDLRRQLHGAAVPGMHAVPRLQQVAHHAPAHQAEAEIGDVGHVPHPLRHDSAGRPGRACRILQGPGRMPAPGWLRRLRSAPHPPSCA